MLHGSKMEEDGLGVVSIGMMNKSKEIRKVDEERLTPDNKRRVVSVKKDYPTKIIVGLGKV